MLVVLACLIFLFFNHSLCFKTPKLRGKAISEYIDSLHFEGVMVEGLSAHYIAYQTDKRVVIIPHERGLDIAQMLLSIKVFDIRYVVWSEKNKNRYEYYPSIDYAEHNFQYLKMIKEDNDVYFVFKVPKTYRADKRQVTTHNQGLVHRQRQTRYN